MGAFESQRCCVIQFAAGDLWYRNDEDLPAKNWIHSQTDLISVGCIIACNRFRKQPSNHTAQCEQQLTPVPHISVQWTDSSIRSTISQHNIRLQLGIQLRITNRARQFARHPQWCIVFYATETIAVEAVLTLAAEPVGRICAYRRNVTLQITPIRTGFRHKCFGFVAANLIWLFDWIFVIQMTNAEQPGARNTNIRQLAQVLCLQINCWIQRFEIGNLEKNNLHYLCRILWARNDVHLRQRNRLVRVHRVNQIRPNHLAANSNHLVGTRTQRTFLLRRK